MLVKKSTDLKLNLPLSRRLSLLRCSFSCGIGQLIFVASPLFFVSFVTFFFFFRRRPGTFLKCRTLNALNALSASCPPIFCPSFIAFLFFLGSRSGSVFHL